MTDNDMMIIERKIGYNLINIYIRTWHLSGTVVGAEV